MFLNEIKKSKNREGDRITESNFGQEGPELILADDVDDAGNASKMCSKTRKEKERQQGKESVTAFDSTKPFMSTMEGMVANANVRNSGPSNNASTTSSRNDYLAKFESENSAMVSTNIPSRSSATLTEQTVLRKGPKSSKRRSQKKEAVAGDENHSVQSDDSDERPGAIHVGSATPVAQQATTDDHWDNLDTARADPRLDNDDLEEGGQQQNNQETTSTSSDVEVGVPIAAEIANDYLEEEVWKRMQEERQKQVVADATEIKAVDDEEDTTNQSTICGLSQRSFFVLVGIFGVVIVAIVAVIVALLTSSNKSNGDESTAINAGASATTLGPTQPGEMIPTVSLTLTPSETPTTYSPTVNPTQSPTHAPVPPTPSPTETRFQQLVNFIGPTITPDVETLSYPITPQYAVLNWLANEDTWVVDDIMSVPVQIWVERYALALFYDLTNGVEWAPTDDNEDSSFNFLEPVSVCDWHAGIVCDDSFYVNRLDFNSQFGSSTELEGAIPSEIGLLTNLQHLSFRDNSLTGSIPSTIGNLVSLTWLDLADNGLNGNLVTEIGFLSNLQMLLLSNTHLRGNLPSEVGMLEDLSHLSVYGSYMTGKVPTQIGKLTSMTHLDLRVNYFTELPSEIGELALMHSLYLGGGGSFGIDDLVGTLPSELGRLTSLTTLFLVDTLMSGSLPSEIGRWTNIEELRLQNNNFVGTLPSEIGRWTNIESLSLYDNLWSGALPSQIGQCTKLSSLQLHNNAFTGTLPSDLGLLTDMFSLSLSNNTFTGQVPSELSNMLDLYRLYLDGNAFSGSLDGIFCEPRPETLFRLDADCGGDMPEVVCSCCNKCCNSTACCNWSGDYCEFY